MRWFVAVFVAAALTATGPATARTAAGEAELAKAVGTRQPGQPVDCISPQNQTAVQVIEGTAIIYGYGTRVYVNRPTEGADALRSTDVLIAHVYRNELCRLDTVTLQDATSRLPRGVVTLGPFIPYSRLRR